MSVAVSIVNLIFWLPVVLKKFNCGACLMTIFNLVFSVGKSSVETQH